MERDSRTIRLIGEEAYERLRASRVMVAGLGGVGGYVVEMLARTGVGSLVIIDSDCVAESNINRQIIADTSTVGIEKTKLWTDRIGAVNPEAEVIPLTLRLDTRMPAEIISQYSPDFVADAIDSVSAKCALIAASLETETPIISSMGAGGRLDPSSVCYCDLWSTSEDGLARAVRNKLKQMKLRRPLPVVWSREAPRRRALIEVDEPGKLTSFGTLATVPATFGIFMGSYIIRKIIQL